MKHLLAMTAAALLALPLVADETKTKSTSTPAAKPVASSAEKRPQTRVIQAPVPVVEDSPLVAASRRANRLGKTPKNLITNETLKTVGGHFTTTERQYAVEAPPPPSQAEMTAKVQAEIAARQKREADEAAQRERARLAQEQQRRANEAVDVAEDAYESDDPARDEYRAEQAAKNLQEQKKPHR